MTSGQPRRVENARDLLDQERQPDARGPPDHRLQRSAALPRRQCGLSPCGRARMFLSGSLFAKPIQVDPDILAAGHRDRRRDRFGKSKTKSFQEVGILRPAVRLVPVRTRYTADYLLI